MPRPKNGFTLIELIVVIAIIAVLAVVVFVGLNPAKRLADARDSRRTTDVNSLLTAIHSSIIDTRGAQPTSLLGDTPGLDYQIGTATGAACLSLNQNNCAVSSGNCDNLTSDLAKYLKTLPIDPKVGTASLSGYVVNVDANNIVTVKACYGENNTSIQSSR